MLPNNDAVDAVTGLPSLSRFLKGARACTAHMRSQGDRPVALALNLVGLSTYNTRFGSGEAERLLRNFASVLRTHFGMEFCTRYSNDLFYTYVAEDELSQKLPFVFDDFAALDLPGILPVHAGAYVCEPDDDICEVGFHRAEIASKLDSATWQSGLRWFTDEMRLEARLRLHVCARLNQAIAEEWVSPLYQPIVRAATGEVCGVEALARWYDPQYGELMPHQFIPTLQEAGLSHTLDLYIVDCVLRDIKTMQESGLGVTPVSVNISPFDFTHADVVNELVRRTDEAGISHDLIRVEVAESLTAYDLEAMKHHIERFRNAGFEVWLDDFGHGYTSLDALCHIRVDAVKLDMETMHSEMGRKASILVEGVIRTAASLGVSTIAEGVETREAAEYLEGIGCDMLQGHCFARPLRFDVLVAHARIHDSMTLEPISEQSYWDAVSAVDLEDLSVMDGTFDVNGVPVSTFPAGIVECREGTWRVLRANESYRDFLHSSGLLSDEPTGLRAHEVQGRLEKSYFESARGAKLGEAWEKMSGRLEYGSNFQYYARHIASVPGADAYLVGGIPTMLGNALGSYGDVPVAYAVFRVVLSEAGDEVVDTEYVYANDIYCRWLDVDRNEIVGKSFLSTNANASTEWFPYCYRAVVLGESVHDVLYSPEIGHWLSFNLEPSPVEGHCVYAFSIADAERRERDAIIRRSEELERESMLDGLTGVLNRRGIDVRVAQRLERGDVERYALMLMDIDDFKTINDRYGHDVGDEALRLIARTLGQVFPREAIVGRNGGDEFLVMLCNDDVHDVVEFIETLQARDLSFVLNERDYTVSMSLGFVTYPDQAGDLKEAYRKADAALYAVKLSGKAGYDRYRPQMETQYRSQLGFTPRDVAENIPGAIMVHNEGFDGDILFANDNMVSLLECDDLLDMLEFTGGVYGGMVHPDDAERVRGSLDGQVNSAETGVSSFLQFRVVTKTGRVRRVAQNGRPAEVEDKSRVVYELIIELDDQG